MTRCGECVHWEPIDTRRISGRCGLMLPPHVEMLTPFTTPNLGCDLGTPKDKT